MRAAIIGGTGVYNLSGENRQETVNTPYGKVKVDIQKAGDLEVVFLARHGQGHSVPPHLVNYRANMWSLKELGVKYVYATAAVGSCHESFKPGDLVVIKDFIDFTKSRPVTFYDGKEGVIHTDMSDPYCQNLRRHFEEVAKEEGLDVAGQGVYICTEGPRFETAAEIRMFNTLGAHVVGMTNVPEVVLAKELQMCYAAVGMVTNWCTGMGGDVTKDDILKALEKNKQSLTSLFLKIFASREMTQDECTCSRALMKL